MKQCKRCILNDSIKGVFINNESICNICENYSSYIPLGEENLVKILEKAKKKKSHFDVLVPFSGGKDSTYILYLATKVYKLKTLAFTYDNGFFSDLALENIKEAIKNAQCDFIFYHPEKKFLHKIYKETLMQSGEICGVCGIGITNSIQKASEDWNIPITLMGYSPVEVGSFPSENIYDYHRLKTILKTNNKFTNTEINRFLIYPKLDHIKNYIKTYFGKFGKKVSPLFYLPLITDKEMGNIIRSEMGWKDSDSTGYTRHFDCIAEPLTNYIREKRYGNSRRIFQLSNMIRNGEITRDEALSIYKNDKSHELPDNKDHVLEKLNMTNDDLIKGTEVEIGKWEWAISKRNKVFSKLRKILIK